MLSTIQATTPARPAAGSRGAAPQQPSAAPADSVAIGAHDDPMARVDRLIHDLRSGAVSYAPEISAKTRQAELTLGSFPCKKYILEAGQQVDARQLATEIVPRGEKSRYKHAVTEESKLTRKENVRDLEARAESINGLANELKRQGTESLMVLVDGDNAGGKDGILTHVFALSPLVTAGVKSFKAAKGDEAKHEPNWRIMQNLAGPGQMGFHNRTGYGDIVFAARTPEQKAQRAADLREMEYGLTMGLPMTPEGHIALPDAKGLVDPSAIQRPPMRFIKIMLNVSKAEQAARLADRLVNDRKTDKMSPADLEGHAKHDDIQTAFANAFAATSTPWAPSYCIPHDNKETGWRKVAQIVDEVLHDMDPQRPLSDVSAAERKALAKPLLTEAEKARRK